MAKQTFTTGQVLTAAQMTSLQQTAMGGGSATAKTASYTLVAADAGTTVIMNSASATTITINTSLFSAGDTVFIQNIGAGVCTITAGTATVNTASSLALAQYESGNLYFTATSASIFSKADGAAAGGGGKVLQVVSATDTTGASVSTTTLTDSGITATITPTSATSKIFVIISAALFGERTSADSFSKYKVLRGATDIGSNNTYFVAARGAASATNGTGQQASFTKLDSPATTSATTYKMQIAVETSGSGSYIASSPGGAPSTITLFEIGA